MEASPSGNLTGGNEEEEEEDNEALLWTNKVPLVAIFYIYF
jgi:hypothetical protein